MTATLVAIIVAVLILGAIWPHPARLIDGAARPATVLVPAPPTRRRRQLAVGSRAVGFVVVAILIDPILAVAAILGAASWPRVRNIAQRRRTQRLIDNAVPDAIEMLILIVHAGLTPHQAMAMLTERAPHPTRFGFVEVQRRVDRGATLADALAALPELLGTHAVAVADTLAIAERHGTPIAQTLEQLATDVRERRRRQAEAAARRLPVQMSFPLVTCTLPAFVLIAIVPAVLAALRSLGGTGL
jgi:tight adherence protein C